MDATHSRWLPRSAIGLQRRRSNLGTDTAIGGRPGLALLGRRATLQFKRGGARRIKEKAFFA